MQVTTAGRRLTAARRAAAVEELLAPFTAQEQRTLGELLARFISSAREAEDS